jgi:two-component system, sensor histidine kinase RegB
MVMQEAPMSVTEFEMFQDRQRSNWVRLRTLNALRWVAIIGQSVALIVAVYVFSLIIEVGLAAITIGASIILNLVYGAVFPGNKRLTEREAFGMLVFDIVQLSLLLYLTGGINNPFAILLLAPVTISATVLHLKSTVVLGGAAVALVSLLGYASLPIETETGALLVLPALFQFGFWLAIVIGVVFLAIYAWRVTTEMHNMGDALLATQLALSREQKLTDLGGLVAATAHELGTPLATIMLVSGELRNESEEGTELREDLDLIHDQANRCKDILQSMGKAGKDDLHLHQTPLEALVREAAAPHLDRGKTIVFYFGSEDLMGKTHPVVQRRPEIIHGLRNLIQNAVDFADTRVEITGSWTETEIRVQIADDGAGFPTSVIGRIGDPFVGRKRANVDSQKRPGYSGMGLGLFIAKTLLERSGARLRFRNAAQQSKIGGAVIDVIWLRDSILKSRGIPLGENQNFTAH